MSENGTINIAMMKNWVSHILFLRKMGLIVYLSTLKRGLFGTHIHTMSYIGSYPPSPPHLDEEERVGCFILVVFLMSCDC